MTGFYRRVRRSRARGFRSIFEMEVADSLVARGVAFMHEGGTLRYIAAGKERRYLPDFILANGVIVETKGHWDQGDRWKIAAVKAQNPAADLRMLFMQDKPISPRHQTRHSDICRKLGIPFAVGPAVPDHWLAEPINTASLATLTPAGRRTL